MQANSAEHQPFENANAILSIPSHLMNGTGSAVEETHRPVTEATYFHGYYESCMELYADAQTVASYLDAHREWFCRCALPMHTNRLGENGYALTIGRFGAFNYEVEPKIGLDLLPQDQGVYRIKTIPVPDYEPPGYEVDFNAAMHLVEADATGSQQTPSGKMTKVEWELNLEVAIQFPRFIHALPKSLVLSTGDRLLNQIVRQVSRRLTQKVQEDFHSTMGIPFGKKHKK